MAYRLGADGGDRTHTSFEGQRILSPSRLPVPPRRLRSEEKSLIPWRENARRSTRKSGARVQEPGENNKRRW